jgi:hypothetical protein
LFARILACALGLSGLTACGDKTAIEEVSSFGPLTIGQVAPHFAAAPEGGAEFNSPLPPGKFTVYCIEASLPPVCLDEGCGLASHFVVAKGGRFIGISDLKAASLFGVRARQDNNSKLATSLVVLCDINQRIIAIHKGAAIADIESIVKHSNLQGGTR